MRHQKVVCAGLTLLLGATGIFTACFRARGSNNDSLQHGEQRLAEDGQLPVVDYNAPEPSNGEKLAKRRAKNKKYNRSRLNVSLLLINKETTVVNDWELGLESTLPSRQSCAVFIGEVVSAQAHLSEDKTGVYSEFMIRVEEILKNDGTAPLSVGELTAAEREGGTVRAPMGHLHPFRISGQGVPRVGRRYLFFLGQNPREEANAPAPRDMSRNILTAYEFRASKVVPLDSAGGKDFHTYRGKDENSFLDEVRRSIAASQ